MQHDNMFHHSFSFPFHLTKTFLADNGLPTRSFTSTKLPNYSLDVSSAKGNDTEEEEKTSTSMLVAKIAARRPHITRLSWYEVEGRSTWRYKRQLIIYSLAQSLTIRTRQCHCLAALCCCCVVFGMDRLFKVLRLSPDPNSAISCCVSHGYSHLPWCTNRKRYVDVVASPCRVSSIHNKMRFVFLTFLLARSLLLVVQVKHHGRARPVSYEWREFILIIWLLPCNLVCK
jgi:hypothetical protein